MGITTQGREWYVDKVQDVAPLSNAKMDKVGWGTGTTAEAPGDTDLVTQAPENRVTGTLSQPTGITDRCVGEITATAQRNISEVGRFNTTTKQDAGQRMLQRHVFTAIPVENLDRIEFTLDTLVNAG